MRSDPMIRRRYVAVACAALWMVLGAVFSHAGLAAEESTYRGKREPIFPHGFWCVQDPNCTESCCTAPTP